MDRRCCNESVVYERFGDVPAPWWHLGPFRESEGSAPCHDVAFVIFAANHCGFGVAKSGSTCFAANHCGFGVAESGSTCFAANQCGFGVAKSGSTCFAANQCGFGAPKAVRHVLLQTTAGLVSPKAVRHVLLQTSAGLVRQKRSDMFCCKPVRVWLTRSCFWSYFLCCQKGIQQ
jgi:hypothetical protein